MNFRNWAEKEKIEKMTLVSRGGVELAPVLDISIFNERTVVSFSGWRSLGAGHQYGVITLNANEMFKVQRYVNDD